MHGWAWCGTLALRSVLIPRAEPAYDPVPAQVDASDERIGQRIAQEYLGSAPRVAAQAGAASADRTLTRLNTFKAGDEVCIH